METWRFDFAEPKYDDPHETSFPALDLVACIRFKSATSISFKLLRKVSEVHKDLGPRTWFSDVGELVVHHPCAGGVKAYIHVRCPVEYHVFEKMQGLVSTVFEALGIPSDETFLAEFVNDSEQMTFIVNDIDRDGIGPISTYCRVD
jgi:hypothetical protein